MRRWIPALLAVLLLASSFPQVAHGAASRAELEQRLQALEQTVDNQGLLELSRQVDELGVELRKLRGDMEELQHAVEQGKSQQRAQYLDLDKRLKALEDDTTRLEASVPSPPDPAAEYQTAFDLLKAGKLPEAKAGFEAFLAAHGDHELASNAQYWLGEVSYVERDYEGALAAFRKVTEVYPTARKAPDATLKAGYCLYELHRYGEARSTLLHVAEKYPDTSAASDAKTRLSRMAEEGH